MYVLRIGIYHTRHALLGSIHTSLQRIAAVLSHFFSKIYDIVVASYEKTSCVNVLHTKGETGYNYELLSGPCVS